MDRADAVGTIHVVHYIVNARRKFAHQTNTIGYLDVQRQIISSLKFSYTDAYLSSYEAKTFRAHRGGLGR